jgi:hypothetical protein
MAKWQPAKRVKGLFPSVTAPALPIPVKTTAGGLLYSAKQLMGLGGERRPLWTWQLVTVCDMRNHSRVGEGKCIGIGWPGDGKRREARPESLGSGRRSTGNS